MISIKKGDKVAIDYEGKFENGEVFDSSIHGEHSHPLVFVVGKGEVIPGFDNAVIGMHEEEHKTFSIKPEEAYGNYDERLQQKIPKSAMALPNNQEPFAGMQLMMGTPEGHRMPVRVSAVEKEIVTLDFNHPLAGKTLVFTITVKGINDTVKEPEHHH